MGIQTWTAAAHLNLEHVYMLTAILAILAPIGQQLNDIITRLREHYAKKHTLKTYDTLASELAKELR